MRLAVLGLNHKTAPVSVRERFSFRGEAADETLHKIKGISGVEEVLLLSTCNRTELYVVMDEAREAARAIMSFVRRLAGSEFSSKYFYNLSGMYCARHLFRVASSLDSLIVGEGQILSQIKNAYQLARGAGMTSIILNTLVNRAIAVGKRVRAETRIAFGNVSVPSVAVDLAADMLGDLTGSSAFIIGAGEMSELVARHLLGRGVRAILFSNRSFARAEELASSLCGPSRYGSPRARAVRFDEMFAHTSEADVIISSTGAPHYVLTEQNMSGVIHSRDGRPLVLIDIAIPRDIDPALGEYPGVTLYNIDDLRQIVDRNRNSRDAEARSAELIIVEEIDSLKERLKYFTMRPTMLSLRAKMDAIREKLTSRAFSKMPDLTDAERRQIEELTRRLEHKFLREPMVTMKQAVGSEDEGEYRLWAGKLFLLDRPGEELGSDSRIEDWD